MYKRFKTASGKRMKVKMTAEEIANRFFLNVSLMIGGAFIGFLLWGTI